jgi:hypothetical protein
MAGGSVEATLELWASSSRDVKTRIRPLFTQERVARSAGQFLDGLLGNEPRKTGWMRAEAAGDPGPWRQQAILGRGRWDSDALRDIVREYALETLANNDAVLVIDETGFLKQGKASCGVARQYTGSAGKITNCQIGVFAAYVSRHGHAFIDRTLYPDISLSNLSEHDSSCSRLCDPNIVDTFTRVCPVMRVCRSAIPIEVIDALNEAGCNFGLPHTIRIDQGSQFTSKELDLWVYANGVTLDFSRPGKPTNNAYVESFNASVRLERLGRHWFLDLDDARAKVEDWARSTTK